MRVTILWGVAGYFIGAVVIWALAGFVALDWNVTRWDAHSRAGLVMFSVVGSAITVGLGLWTQEMRAGGQMSRLPVGGYQPRALSEAQRSNVNPPPTSQKPPPPPPPPTRLLKEDAPRPWKPFGSSQQRESTTGARHE